MSKVITFSRTFQKDHPKAGQPTHFVEKIYKGLYVIKCVPDELKETFNFDIMNDERVKPKYHTIRSGNRFKVGDEFSPRVWSGKPYCSKQIIIAPDIKVLKTWDFEIKVVELSDGYASKIFINGKRADTDLLKTVSRNDGLEMYDFISWFKFPKPFKGQIICWSNEVNY